MPVFERQCIPLPAAQGLTDEGQPAFQELIDSYVFYKYFANKLQLLRPVLKNKSNENQRALRTGLRKAFFT